MISPALPPTLRQEAVEEETTMLKRRLEILDPDSGKKAKGSDEQPEELKDAGETGS